MAYITALPGYYSRLAGLPLISHTLFLERYESYKLSEVCAYNVYHHAYRIEQSNRKSVP